MDNKLRSKHNGELINLVANNVGGFQGSPPGEDICITYADYVMSG